MADFIRVTPKMKRANADLYGYNAEALKVYLALAGYSASATGLSEVIEMSKNTAMLRMATGEFRRLEIQKIIEKTKMTPEQVVEVFFNSKPGIYHGRTGRTPRRRGGVPNPPQNAR